MVCLSHRSKVRASSDDHGTYPGTLRLAVKRSSVFEDSFNKLRSKTAAEMRGKLSVAFAGEEGIDAGGVSREWYSVRACYVHVMSICICCTQHVPFPPRLRITPCLPACLPAHLLKSLFPVSSIPGRTYASMSTRSGPP
jgi:hypothetical protein